MLGVRSVYINTLHGLLVPCVLALTCMCIACTNTEQDVKINLIYTVSQKNWATFIFTVTLSNVG